MPNDSPATSEPVRDAPDGLVPLADHRMRVAVVTGGGSGIGRAIAHGLAAAGYRVAILGRRTESLTETARVQPGITPFSLDVADASRCAAVLADVETQLGPVDILVANAAIYPRVHFLDQSPTSFEETMQINVHGVANAVRAVLPGMLARNAGRVIVMGSLADQNPLPGACAYSVSKGALHPLVRGIAMEIDRQRYPNVLVNELNPGATRTAMSASGHPPEAVYPLVQALIDQPSGGAHGRMFVQDHEVRPNEGPRRMLLRRLHLSPGLMRLIPAPSGEKPTPP
jgi:NAD(P)-dependent dehydrogenase (short-subunit alcohol dehydrogenase family)